MPLFQRLAQNFQAAAIEFREFVKKKNAVVGEADLPRGGRAAAADHPGIADRMVRRAERPRGQERLIGLEPAKRTVDACRTQALGGRQRGQDGRQTAGEHGFSRARRTDHQDIMPPRGRDHQGSFGELLAAHVREIHIVTAQLGEQFIDTRDGRLGFELARKDANGLSQRLDAINGDRFNDGGFPGILGRDQQLRNAPFGG